MSEEGGSNEWCRFSLPTHTLCLKVTLTYHPSPNPIIRCPLPLGAPAPFPADLFENVSFSPRLCCLFYRSLSLCCERLRLLVMEVNLTNLYEFSYLYALVIFNVLYILYSHYQCLNFLFTVFSLFSLFYWVIMYLLCTRTRLISSYTKSDIKHWC